MEDSEWLKAQAQMQSYIKWLKTLARNSFEERLRVQALLNNLNRGEPLPPEHDRAVELREAIQLAIVVLDAYDVRFGTDKTMYPNFPCPNPNCGAYKMPHDPDCPIGALVASGRIALDALKKVSK